MYVGVDFTMLGTFLLARISRKMCTISIEIVDIGKKTEKSYAVLLAKRKFTVRCQNLVCSKRNINLMTDNIFQKF